MTRHLIRAAAAAVAAVTAVAVGSVLIVCTAQDAFDVELDTPDQFVIPRPRQAVP